jgi:serine/threonine-protein kinase
MRGDIERYLAGQAVHVAPPPPVEPPTTVTQPTTMVTPVPPVVEEYQDDDRGTRPGLLVFLAILLLIVLGLAAYLLPKMFASPTDQVQVPSLSGLTDNQARAKLSDAGLTVGTVGRAYNSKVAPNRVVEQSPAADEFVDKGSGVDYTISLGTHPTKVPSIVGASRADAQSALDAAHLNGVFHQVDSDQPKGTVVSTDPTPGTQVPRGSDVNVSMSAGPLQVPNVVGMTRADAVQALRQRGFNAQVSPDNNSTQPKNTVTGQTPPEGTRLPQGSTVFITVSTYEPSSPPTSPPTTEPTSPTTSVPTSPAT